MDKCYLTLKYLKEYGAKKSNKKYLYCYGISNGTRIPVKPQLAYIYSRKGQVLIWAKNASGY